LGVRSRRSRDADARRFFGSPCGRELCPKTIIRPDRMGGQALRSHKKYEYGHKRVVDSRKRGGQRRLGHRLERVPHSAPNGVQPTRVPALRVPCENTDRIAVAFQLSIQVRMEGTRSRTER
jgi:hypothetical protein